MRWLAVALVLAACSPSPHKAEPMVNAGIRIPPGMTLAVGPMVADSIPAIFTNMTRDTIGAGVYCRFYGSDGIVVASDTEWIRYLPPGESERIDIRYDPIAGQDAVRLRCDAWRYQ